MTKTIEQVLHNKALQGMFTVAPQQPALEAARALAERRIGALMVMEDGRLVGILSERDLVRALSKLGDLSGTLVVHLMTHEVETVTPGTSVEEAMELMTEGRMRHLPVVDGGRVVGIVSIGDLVKEAMESQRYLIGQLEGYIQSAPG